MEILHSEAQHRFWTEIEGWMAYVDYQLTANEGLDIRHTIVPEEIGGRGIAAALVKAAYDYGKSKGLKPIATCSYALVWLKRLPEYHGEVGDDFGGEGTCAL